MYNMNLHAGAVFLLTVLSFLPTVLSCEHQPGMHTVNCTSRGLRKVPINTFIGVVSQLVLTSNNLEILVNNAFGEYPDVTSLYLKKNNIRIVQEKAFQGLDKLVILDLSFNKISFFYNTAFVSNVNLETLNLNENPLQNLNPMTPLISSKSLSSLLLSKSNITSVTKHTFAGLDNLELLDLTSNYLGHIPEDVFTSLTKLEHVYLEGNPTTESDVRTLPRKPRQTTRLTSTSIGTSTQGPIKTRSSDAAYSSSTSTTPIDSSSSEFLEGTDAKSAQEPTVSPKNGEKKKMNTDEEYFVFSTVLVYVYGAMIVLMLITCVVVVFLLRHHINNCFNKLHHRTSTVDLRGPGVDAAGKPRLGRRSSLEPIFESIVDLSNI